MKLIVISIFIIFTISLYSKLSNDEIKAQTIEFTNKLIENSDSLNKVFMNEKKIRTDFLLDIDYSDDLIESYALIINSQKKNNFFLSEFKIQNGIRNERLAILIFRKHDNFFYNFYALLFGNGCNNRVTYLYSIINDEIYFRSISICQHMDPSDLDD